ncbi:alpha/beta hydrolase fold domain-containing protein [bacterium]|nr:alpha/beta hydrolase fold domain-containing protein [bacterium]
MKKLNVIYLIISIVMLGLSIALFCFGSSYSYLPLIIGLIIINLIKAKKLIFKTIYFSLYLIYFVLLFLFSLNVIKFKTNPITDYDKMIPIWGDTIPGNSTKSKLDEMNIRYNTNKYIATNRFLSFIAFKNPKYAERVIDTFTYSYEIRSGYAKETFEDVPFIVPYVVEGSSQAVIIIPGGGYANKSMEDGGTLEGKNVALELNKKGISAFVLWYRSNPYEFPIPQMDLQRAIKYLKYHKEEYGIDDNKISIIGFSAGGYQVSSYINIFMGMDMCGVEGEYTKDEIDLMDDSVYKAALIYPELEFTENYSIMYATFSKEKIDDKDTRKELQDRYNTIDNMKTKVVKQYIAYGNRDNIVGTKSIEKYIEKAKELGIDIKVSICKGQMHAFDTKYYIDDYLEFMEE